MVVDLPSGQILTGLQLTGSGQNFALQANQFTVSIPGAGAVWPDPDYTPGEGLGHEPFSAGYSVVNPDQADDFREALNRWDELVLPDYTEIVENGSTTGEVRVAFTAIDDPGTAGYAYSSPPQDPGGHPGDVWVDADDAAADFSPGTANFETFLHEIGHVFGEKHPFESPFLDTDGIDPDYNNNRYTVMSYTSDQGFVATFTDTGGGGIGFSASTEGTAVATTPMVLDVFFVQAIYGVETTTRAGNTTYAPIETDLSMSTIFDSGGTDTLDLSAFTRKNIVDLRPGAYSSIGFFPEADQREFWKAQFGNQFQKQFIDDTYDNNAGFFYEHDNNLGIAFSTVIENAFGGANHDNILGNDAGNELRGNGGDDTLQGGKGDDTINGGADNDIAVYSGNRSDYAAQVEGPGFRLTDQRGGADDEGSDVVTGIETYRFADGDVSAAELVGSNLPPTANADMATTDEDTAVTVPVLDNDTDPESDNLTVIAAGNAVNGTLSAIGPSTVTFTPTAGFSGTGSFTYTISDGNGGTDSASVSITVNPVIEPPVQNFSLFVADGFAGQVGGSGTVFGTAVFQDIGILDAAGTTALDPSFNRGGDIVRFSGNADQWLIARSGSSARLTDGDTIVNIPVGTAGLVLSFDDGERTLLFDGSSFSIGGQTFAISPVTITAGDDGSPLPSGADPAAKGVLFLAADGEVTVSGKVDIFGASGHEMVSLLSGNLTLDPSFNRGGDTIRFDDPASDFFARQSGSSLFLDGADTDALIPVGTSGATLGFAGGDSRTLLLDIGIPGITVAGQLIGTDPVQLMAL